MQTSWAFEIGELVIASARDFDGVDRKFVGHVRTVALDDGQNQRYFVEFGTMPGDEYVFGATFAVGQLRRPTDDERATISGRSPSPGDAIPAEAAPDEAPPEAAAPTDPPGESSGPNVPPDPD